MNIASSGSWVTNRQAAPLFFSTCSVASRTWSRSRASRPENGLVQQHHPGLGRQRAGQRHPLLLPAREHVRKGVRVFGDADLAQHLLRPLPARRAVAKQPERDIVAHVEMREQRVVLKHQPHAALLRRHVDRVIARTILPLSRMVPCCNRSSPAARRSAVDLPRPTAQQAHDLARPDAHGEIVDGANAGRSDG